MKNFHALIRHSKQIIPTKFSKGDDKSQSLSLQFLAQNLNSLVVYKGKIQMKKLLCVLLLSTIQTASAGLYCHTNGLEVEIMTHDKTLFLKTINDSNSKREIASSNSWQAFKYTNHGTQFVANVKGQEIQLDFSKSFVSVKGSKTFSANFSCISY
jgi:hypothetical protein